MELERDLGLYAVLTVSIGAMIGSGIFVLPGLASKMAGPAVILAYLLAGLLVLPAALSKAEMATAMPEAGGTYLYIDRAMGPRLGTIAGIGAWFSLVFKSAFALVGLGAYLVLFTSLPPKPVALAIAVVLLGVNVVGVKQTGRLQAAIVTVVLAALVFFVADGITYVQSGRYHPFFPNGEGGVLAATGFVFVSYAGVTKIASIAEEVENPSRNLPIGMLGSVLLMMLVYTFVVFVIVGVTPPATLEKTLTPMADAAAQTVGPLGIAVFAGVAVFALSSMANAGILSSSRFPFAMSRDALAPPAFERVHGQFKTPVVALAVTGGLLVVLIAFVPVLELAKLASAFKILVFSLVNVALVAFRESNLESYDPDFVAPGYPWVQLFGILGGLVLLTQMGALPIVGAIGIVVAGLVWYRFYGRERTEREGAALDAIRQSSADRALQRTREASDFDAPNRVLVPFGRVGTMEEKRNLVGLVRLAADVATPDGVVQLVRFEEVPEQLALSAAAGASSPESVEFEKDSGELVGDLPATVEVGEVVTHDAKRAVANFAAHYDVDLVVGEWHPSRWRAELLGADVDWYMTHAPCDVIFVRNRGYDDVERITVVADQGPYDPLEVVAADALAIAHGATVQFVTAVSGDASDEQVATAEEYLAALANNCRADTGYAVLTDDDRLGAVVDAAASSDLVLVGTSAHHLVYNVLFGTVPDLLVERLDATVLLAHARRTRRHTFLHAVLERFVY